MFEKFLIFDVWGDYAHFKKFYTISSPLTFSIPPRTAIIGLISAIIGLDKIKYLESMTKSKAEIAIRIINPIKKVRITQNLIDTKGGYFRPIKRGNLTGRTQITFEYIKDPRFRIYFRHYDEKIHNLTREFLRNHKSVYTPYLGISELICNFKFIEEVEILEVLNEKETEVHTAIPLDEIIDFEPEEGKKYFKDIIPTEILPNRIMSEYRDVLYEIEGKTIKAKIKFAFKLKNNDVIIVL